MFIVNGRSTGGLWRIDYLDEETGLDFLTHPAMLVRDLELAERVVVFLNQECPNVEGGTK